MESLLQTPLGMLCLRWQVVEQGGMVLRVRLPNAAPTLAADLVAAPEWLEHEFQAYFRDPTHVFAIRPQLAGTPFQQRVWQMLRGLPCGEVRRYGELAEALGSSPRAVGNACRANPCPILVPCHRVVARRGLGGFAGQTAGMSMDIKARLLQHEGVNLAEFGA